MITTGKTVYAIALTAVAVFWATSATAQEVKRYRFAYDQPKSTGYGVAGDLFADKLKELSNGTMLIEQYPGAQLGQEPQVLQLVKSGDIEFCISSSASLIGRFESSAFKPSSLPFRLSTTAVSMSLAGSCFSSESAPGPFHYGIRERGGTI